MSTTNFAILKNIQIYDFNFHNKKKKKIKQGFIDLMNSIVIVSIIFFNLEVKIFYDKALVYNS